MKKEIDPKESPRGRAFELWKTAAMPKVTIFKTFDITRLIKVAKRSGMKTNMLMCWCIGHAASSIEEFYILPAGGHLWQYDRLAVNTVVKTMNGDAHLCDIPFSANIHQFIEDYLQLTSQVHDTNEDHLFGEDYMAIDTSALVECEIDGVASVYSELFTNPFLAWGKYRRKFFKTTLPISFQFHHAQMDGFEAARFLNELQKVIDKLNI
jgi:chloramphenicol O-acetyltransferase type A